MTKTSNKPSGETIRLYLSNLLLGNGYSEVIAEFKDLGCKDRQDWERLEKEYRMKLVAEYLIKSNALEIGWEGDC